jgi:hypothetical protein
MRELHESMAEDIEKNTVKYIRENYKFTVEADAWFRTDLRKWAATKGH